MDHAGHTTFPVTADQGIQAWAPDKAELFRQAALALWGLILDPADVRRARAVSITADAPDDEILLVAWLNEQLYIAETEHLAAADCAVNAVSDTEITGTVWGEDLDPGRHSVRGHVKAVTYNQLEIRRTPRGWEARVVVDL